MKPDGIPVLLSLETGRFQYRTTADNAICFTLTNTSRLTQSLRTKIAALYKKTTIATRYLANPAFQGEKGALLGHDFRLALLDARLALARNAALPLITEVAKRALVEAKVRHEDVGQLVVVSSTAFGSPGLEGELVRCLQLQSNVLRACINYMGCGAGILGLRWASDFVKGLDDARRSCVSLLVCIEASSFHYNDADDPNLHITHSLFSDGVACAVVAGARSPHAVMVPAKLAILDFESFLIEGTQDGICLRMSTQGIECLLSPRLPETLGASVRLWLNTLLERNGTPRKMLGFWAIHPGGPKIIEKVVQGLNLPNEVARFSWESLREHGNTLSCGVFYVLRAMFDSNAIKPGDHGVVFSFSPGVGIEGVLLHALPDSTSKTGGNACG